MLDVRDLSIEMKSTAGFGIAAFILSLLMGLVFGIGFGTVILRSLILMILFAGLGFAVITVIKRFVPELYAVFQGAGTEPSESGDVDSKDSSIPMDLSDEGPAGDSEASQINDKEKEFSELSKDDFPKFDSVDDSGLSSGSKNLGKHIISDEKVVTYEPKIMAQAIRTMISRDED